MTSSKLVGVAVVASVLLSAAIPAFAQTTNRTQSRVATSVTAPKVDLVCIQTAFDKREGAVMTAFDARNAEIKTAMQTRRDAIKSAWGLENKRERQMALNAAHKAFRTGANAAQKTFRSAEKSARDEFRKDVKACNQGAASEISGAESDNSSL